MAALAGAAAGCLVGSREAAASVEVAGVVWPAAGPEAVETAAQTGRAAAMAAAGRSRRAVPVGMEAQVATDRAAAREAAVRVTAATAEAAEAAAAAA